MSSKKEEECLLPLLNIPLIEYTLESLAVAGVKEIFVVCCSGADQIKTYLKNSRWNKSVDPIVKTIVGQELLSVGDALRDLDSKEVLKSDFVLVTGDVVSNMNLELAIAQHRERRILDKNSMMTLVLKEASPGHRSRSKNEDSIFILDANTNECIFYESLDQFHKNQTDNDKGQVKFDITSLKGHPEVIISNNLIDCQIDICSLEVPILFTENFDYQDIRKDFIKGILESDILSNTIYAHILTNEYAVRVRSTQMYDSISRDIMDRWSYPIVPDNNMLGNTYYLCARPMIYKDEGVKLASKCVLEHHVTIGANSEIGSNVTLDGAYIWDNVTISDNCTITNSIIANNSHLLQNVILNSGCIVSFGVTLGPNLWVPSLTKFCSEEAIREVFDKEKLKVLVEGKKLRFGDTDAVGEEGSGVVWLDENEYEDDDEIKEGLRIEGIGKSLDEFKFLDLYVSDDGSEDSEYGVDENKREILNIIQRAFRENHTVEIAALELNTLKMALNVKFQDLREAVVPELISLIEPNASNAQTIVSRWKGLLKHFVHSFEDQINIIEIMKSHCTGEVEYLKNMFVVVLKLLYDEDVVEETAILRWDELEDGGEFKRLASPLVEWLNEAEEESEDDED